ncbi:MAG TPA: ribosome maturation factor RimP [Clostridiaceae bacterium]|nr:ribosome maturation factor RimP [Clostridiaceae bacterium]
MAKRKVEDVVTKLALPIVEKYSFELVDVEFVKEGANWYLRVYIDKEGGITLDDCQVVSEELSVVLDEADPIDQRYFLEVSSPGIERPLKKDKDFERYKGHPVVVKTFNAIDGKKEFEGELVGLIDNKIVIKTDSGHKDDDNNIMEFDRDKVAMVRKTFRF